LFVGLFRLTVLGFASTFFDNVEYEVVQRKWFSLLQSVNLDYIISLKTNLKINAKNQQRLN
jgi:predicted DNA-binding protein (MmcQ/YjbR family)